MKKVLSIVLSIVMVLCMMPAMAFAGTADFTDAADIEYTEAVEVLTAAGIINGQPDGSFEPNGNVTREQAAKLIATVLKGDKADDLATSAAPFADVAADRWSAGYIAYCVEKGIVDGVGNNKFDPTGNVTALQLAKMLLIVAGYDAAVEGMTGAKWAANTSDLAEEVELFAGNDAVLEHQPASREEAALYILNALQTTMVTYTDKGTNVTLPDGTTIVSGAQPENDVPNNATTETIVNDDKMQVAEKYVSKLTKVAGETDAFGRPASAWQYDGEDVGTYQTEEPVASYTTEVKLSEVWSDLGIAGELDPTNGRYFTVTTLTTDGGAPTTLNAKIYKDNTGYVGASGEGVLVEYYKVSDNTYRMVVVKEHIAQVSEVKDAVAKTEEARKIKVDGKYFETEEFAKNDWVIYTIAGNEIQTVELATKVENVAVTAYNSTSVTANGVTYKYNDSYTNRTFVTKDHTYTFWLDSYGNIIKSDDYEAAASTDYVYVKAVSTTAQGDATVETQFRNVKYVDATGVETIVKVAEANLASLDNNADNGFVTTEVTGKWFTLASDAKNAGFVKLVNLDPNEATTETGTPSTITKTAPTIATGIVANAKTVFVLETEADKYVTYTGIANIPTYAPKAPETTIPVSAVVEDGYAQVVYVNAIKAATENTTANEVVYLFNKTASDSGRVAGADADYIAYKVFDGKTVKDVKFAAGVIDGSIDAGAFIELKAYDKNGYVAEAANYSTDMASLSAGELSYSEGTLNNTYTVASDAVVYEIDGTEVDTMELTELDEYTTNAGAWVVYTSEDVHTVKAIYVVK